MIEPWPYQIEDDRRCVRLASSVGAPCELYRVSGMTRPNFYLLLPANGRFVYPSESSRLRLDIHVFEVDDTAIVLSEDERWLRLHTGRFAGYEEVSSGLLLWFTSAICFIDLEREVHFEYEGYGILGQPQMQNNSSISYQDDLFRETKLLDLDSMNTVHWSPFSS